MSNNSNSPYWQSNLDSANASITSLQGFTITDRDGNDMRPELAAKYEAEAKAARRQIEFLRKSMRAPAREVDNVAYGVKKWE
jgi:hypothetical protein